MAPLVPTASLCRIFLSFVRREGRQSLSSFIFLFIFCKRIIFPGMFPGIIRDAEVDSFFCSAPWKGGGVPCLCVRDVTRVHFIIFLLHVRSVFFALLSHGNDGRGVEFNLFFATLPSGARAKPWCVLAWGIVLAFSCLFVFGDIFLWSVARARWGVVLGVLIFCAVV
ncbi:unnamed protein product [Pylaiella littoralis]